MGDKGHSVRQIIINLNVANTAKHTSGEHAGEYSDRPVFFYYTGPEKVSDYDKRVPDEHVRDSLPVIINFNADFRGIFFFPNSPVVVNGNQKNFEGYVIAKEYVMLKKYEDGDFLYDESNKVYYDRNLLVETFHGEKVKDSSYYQAVTVDGQTKYILNSDLENYSPADSDFETVKHNSFYYEKGSVGTAEELAYASGNGKVSYYSTNDKNGADESWTTKVGEGYFDHSLTKRFVYFPKSYVTEKNWSYTGTKSVWRAKEILPDGSEGDWLDKREDAEYKDRYMVNWGNDIVILYDTAEELLNNLDGYTNLDDNTWEKTGAVSYMKLTTEDEKIYYIPIDDNIHLRNGEEPTVSNTVLVKYRDGDTEKTGYANLSDNPEKYYLMYQDDYNGNPTTNNPMFVDELGNVQYKHKKDSSGKKIATNSDGSVAYETITPSKTATSLIYKTSIKARDDGVPGNEKYATGTGTNDEGKLLYKTTIIKKTISTTDENGNPIEKEVFNEYVTHVTNSDGTLKTLSENERILLSTKDSEGNIIATYAKNEANIVYTQAYERGFDPSLRMYEEDSMDSKYPFLEEGEISQYFFDKNQFNLATSRFDNFQLVKMTEYRYLNGQRNQRSLDNFFTSDRSKKVD